MNSYVGMTMVKKEQGQAGSSSGRNLRPQASFLHSLITHPPTASYNYIHNYSLINIHKTIIVGRQVKVTSMP